MADALREYADRGALGERLTARLEGVNVLAEVGSLGDVLSAVEVDHSEPFPKESEQRIPRQSALRGQGDFAAERDYRQKRIDE